MTGAHLWTQCPLSSLPRRTGTEMPRACWERATARRLSSCASQRGRSYVRPFKHTNAITHAQSAADRGCDDKRPSCCTCQPPLPLLHTCFLKKRRVFIPPNARCEANVNAFTSARRENNQDQKHNQTSLQPHHVQLCTQTAQRTHQHLRTLAITSPWKVPTRTHLYITAYSVLHGVPTAPE